MTLRALLGCLQRRKCCAPAADGFRRTSKVVCGLWDSWDDEAVLHDRSAGVYAGPAKVHELGHVGQYSRRPDR